MRSLALLAASLVCSGCATIFTGTRQDISMVSEPPGSTVVVLGGTAATLLVKAKNVSDLKDRVIDLIAPSLRPEDRAFLAQLTTDELVTQAVMGLKLADVPPDLVATASTIFTALPGPVADKVRDLLGVEGVGVTPWKLELHKGKAYAVVTWQRGRKARLLVIDTTFNWVVLLNVFVAIVPGVIDLLTGAWLNLSPSEVQYTLDPAPAAVQPNPGAP